MHTFFEDKTTLELQFSDGTLKIISIDGLPDNQKRQWRDWAKKLYESGTFISGWSID